MQKHSLPSVKLRLAKEMERGYAELWVVTGSAECASSSFSASNSSRKEQGLGQSGTVEDGRSLPYCEVRSDGSRRNKCQEPDSAAGFTTRAESSSDSASSRGVQGRVTCSERVVSIAVTSLTGPSKWQEELTAEWNKHARTGFPKYVTVHREWVGNQTRGCDAAGSLELFWGHVVNETVGSQIEDGRKRRLCSYRTRKWAERLYYQRVFR